MHYVISDIHGCYNEYIKLLEKIKFSDSDTLYVLGDIVDRGPAPIKVLKDMMRRPNVIPLAGNHEMMALSILPKLCSEINDGFDNWLNRDFMRRFDNWCENGGNATIEEFSRLPKEEQQDILDYLGDFDVLEEVTVNGKRFVLVHAGLEPFDDYLEDGGLTVDQMLWNRVDLDCMYFKDKLTITGHTPTPSYEKGNDGTVIERNNHIAIDCGCVFGYRLAAYCLETGEKIYVDSEKRIL